jgi:hypothetical protein
MDLGFLVFLSARPAPMRMHAMPPADTPAEVPHAMRAGGPELEAKAAVRAFTDSIRSELIHARSRVRLTHLALPDEPLPGDRGAHGRFDGEARGWSATLAMRMHPVATAAGAALVAAGAASSTARLVGSPLRGFACRGRVYCDLEHASLC